jgi:hypothetical protein
MRALIRASLHPARVFDQLWDDYPAYRKHVLLLFRNIGYAPKHSVFPRNEASLAAGASSSGDIGHFNPTPVNAATSSAINPTDTYEVCPNWKEVTDIFEDVPKDLRLQEMQHMIMLGYSSEGQGNFVVCAINPSELHIRFRQDLFERLRGSSEGICQKIQSHRRRRAFIKRVWRALRRIHQSGDSSYLKLKPDIDVLEPHRDNATIVGHIVQSATRELIKTYYGEIATAVVTFVIALYLFFAAPSLAPKAQAWLFRSYDIGYVQGAIERIYSAFLVTAFVTGLDLGMKWFEFKKDRPIRWNSGIDAIKQRKSRL